MRKNRTLMKTLPTTSKTFKQYLHTVRSDARAEYGITWAEAEEFYPEHYLRPRWMEEMVRYANQGGIVPDSVVRTLTPDETYTLVKFGYLLNRYVVDGRLVSVYAEAGPGIHRLNAGVIVVFEVEI